MLRNLKFVQGALKATVIAPELEYFQIRNGRVTGFNGYMALSAPIELDLDVKPKAKLFHKAIEACGEAVSLNMTPGGRLHVKSGGFSAFIPCIEGEVYEAAPQGEMYDAPGELLSSFTRLLPIISQDASRPWAMGLGVGNGAYTATNNIAIVQIWEGNSLPAFNLPRFAVAEVVRIKEPPNSLQVADHCVTFHWPDGRWMRTQTLGEDWPHEQVNGILDRGKAGEPVTEGLYPALDLLRPFVPVGSNTVRFAEGKLVAGVGEDISASFEVEDIPCGPRFSEKVLSALRDEIRTIDFSAYPDPCGFRGENSRGIILGQR